MKTRNIAACATALLLAGCASPATSEFTPSTATVQRKDEAWPPRRTTVRTTKVTIEPPPTTVDPMPHQEVGP